MKDDCDYEERFQPIKARKIVDDTLRSWSHEEDILPLYERLQKNPDLGAFYKNKSLFLDAVRAVLFDITMDNPNIGTMSKDYVLPLLEQKLEKYATNEGYRNKYTHLARG